MALFKNIIRGGQTNIHQVRMLRQILWIGFLISLLGSLLYGGTVAFKRIPTWAWNTWMDLRIKDVTNLISFEEKKPTFRELAFEAKFKREIKVAGSQAFKIFWMLYWSIVFLWYIKGYFTRRDKHLKGAQFLSPFRLKWLMIIKRRASSFNLDGLPLVKGKETSHILISGTTGSGKTNCLHKLIPQIRSEGHKAILLDLTGDLVSKYYDPMRDVILNPFDQRTKLWSPWADCLEKTHFDAFAKSIIPPSFKGDPFWDEAAKTILSTTLELLEEDKKISKLLNLLLFTKPKDLEVYFKGSKAANLISVESEKTTASILATLGTHLAPFVYLEDTNDPFSLRHWIKEGEGSFLFLTAKPDQRETLRPLLTVWVDIALNGLMSLEPNHQRRLWILIDELPALQRLSSLQMALAESRKYGGCIVAGVQSIAQLEDIYGNNHAATLLDNFNTKIFFRAINVDTAKWISRVLGSFEQREVTENLSYGANTMRDGVNLSDHIKTHLLISETEIMGLRDFEAYIKLPENLPITKLKMKFEKMQSKGESFILKEVNSYKKIKNFEENEKANLKIKIVQKDLSKEKQKSAEENLLIVRQKQRKPRRKKLKEPLI